MCESYKKCIKEKRGCEERERERVCEGERERESGEGEIVLKKSE